MKILKSVSIIAILLNCIFVPISAQIVTENESALIYYMPQTVLLFDVEYEKEDRQIGIFYQYSERYLGTKDVITKNEVVYKIKHIQLRTQTIADQQRAYKITIDNKLLTNYLSLTEDGILCAVNAPCKSQTQPQMPIFSDKEIVKSKALMPLGEEQMLANSIAKMAEGTAKQIYQIRESRLNLLVGDVDKLPNDGESMQIVLNELKQTEKRLCELFVGKSSKQTLRKTIALTPTNDLENQIFFRFSAFSGVVAADDLSGSPVYITLTANKQSYLPTEKKKTDNAELYYNLPGSATVTISDNKQTWINETLPIAQFGISVALPQTMFEKSNIKIHFNTQTGALQSIEK